MISERTRDKLSRMEPIFENRIEAGKALSPRVAQSIRDRNPLVWFWCKLLNWSCAATMTGMPSRQRTPELFKGLHFDHEVVILCVRWYLSYKLSSRDLVNMMGERSVELAHTTILRWYGGTSQGLKSAGTDTHEQSAGHDAATRRI